ncbi:MAG: ATP-dependent DNA helicase PcrA, DNA helicase II / ATP-dependent DNA helicase PcrA [Candidatus Gottesmanbacteria bacterium GW2011_GWA2_43_14]|uniref:DNA 3'-5' helicase n=1 Tax=Candidatus Gottesmanbacteria bacterium GW2011_GWA2_43_14 TaxID=1618443 RepID=A0A0G1FT70_9BACT|nr:MAG: ATP-dependent DNA helicase PcrA, DNA helicase II / ATP-dependent DNA helicase PcrA [Candidatus Gottesmanbacteria bacterium GW2011_GWA2_43_14]
MSEFKLNQSQLEAVRHGSGPLLIIAGAGTGKTTVVTERIRYLIENKHASPTEILALTFTEKAAREMEERVDRILPYGMTETWITTFHAFGDRLLRKEALEIGLSPGFKLMTQAETIIFFRNNLFQFELNYYRPLGNPGKFIEALLTHFDRLRDEDISPNQYLEWAVGKSQKHKGKSDEEKTETEKNLELAYAYLKYEELKVKEGVIDFSDLIAGSLKLFRQRKNILQEYRSRFKFILIDEFQDTNFAQNELTQLLAAEHKNITVVGDDDQAIYRFRGAAVSNIIQFRNTYPEAKIVVLTGNYRSTAAILDTAYRLIQNNNPDRLEERENIDKKLTPERRLKGEAVQFLFEERVEDEAEAVVKKIRDLAAADSGQHKKYAWKDFAILLRANNHSEPFVKALARAGVPYQFLGPGRLFKQKEVKNLIAYLKFLSENDNSVALYRVLSMVEFDIPVRDLAALLNFSKRLGLSLYEGIDTISAHHRQLADHWSLKSNYRMYLPYLSQKTVDTVNKFILMAEKHLGDAKNDTAGQILYSFLEDTGILRNLTEYKTALEEKEAVNISRFFDKLKSYEAGHEDASIFAVSDWIDMSMELGESPLAADSDWTGNDAVNLLTVHSSKGLEFPVVFLVNLVSERFPTRERADRIPIPDELIKEILPEGDYHLEEERRLFYVGATRARDRLYFTSAKYYGEGKRERKISPFVSEALGKLPDRPLHEADQLNLLNWQKSEVKTPVSDRPPIEYLSYSQIGTYLTCPLQYKYRYIIRIPVPQSGAASFGSSMHLALQKFYELYKKGEKPDEMKLLRLLDEAWIPLGFGTKKYEEKMKAKGREMLSAYFEKAFDPKVQVADLEKLFRIKLTPGLKLGGKIDRVDMLTDGRLEIIDYKTGKKPGEKEIKNNLQMTVYALAAEDSGIYNKKPEQVVLSFYFLATGDKMSTSRTKADLEKAGEKIIATAKDIDGSLFEAKVGPWCTFCDFKMICEAWQ